MLLRPDDTAPVALGTAAVIGIAYVVGIITALALGAGATLVTGTGG